MSENKSVKYTTIINKYPSFRDDVLNGCWKWMHGRRADDNAEGLWRVHDKLYDLTAFVDNHPGGREWLTLTEGTDVTEAFESYHITDKATKMLSKFYVRDAAEPRNYKLTYDEFGFYRTLKRRVAKKLENIDKRDIWKSKMFLDLDIFVLFVTAIIAMRTNNYYVMISMILLSGQCMGWLNTLSHNFIHQPNNWRMYTANIVLIGWRDWRVFHGISHHLYPNSYADFEISAFEPYFSYIPIQAKGKFRIWLSYFLTPFVYAFMFHSSLILRISGLLLSDKQKFNFDELLPLALPLSMFFLGDSTFAWSNLQRIFIIWNCIILLGSFLYCVVAFNAGHHGPTIVHEGDEFKGLDFGIYQLGATVDRIEAKSNLFMTLTHFGDHMLHHMFPSLDHSLLPQLSETFIETCNDFKEELREFTLLEAMLGQFQQLSRTKTIQLN